MDAFNVCITNRGTLRPAAAATSNCDAVLRACAQRHAN